MKPPELPNRPAPATRPSIEAITREKESSSIPLSKPAPIQTDKVDLKQSNSYIWGQRQQALLADYNYGWSLGQFGDMNRPDAKRVCDRLSEALIQIISNECMKRGVSADNFSLHFKMISSIMGMISKEIESKKLKDFDPESLVASLHGFIDSYIENVVIQYKKK